MSLRTAMTNALLFRTLDAMLGLPARDWSASYFEIVTESEASQAEARRKLETARVQGTRLSLALDRYLGTYSHPVAGQAVLAQENGKLRLELTDYRDVGGDCDHWHYDAFLCRWDRPGFGASLMPFLLDGQGNVESFRLTIREDWIDSMEYVFRRQP